MNGVASMAACIESASRDIAERPVNVANLAHDTVTAVIAHRDGYRLCFNSGIVIHVERGSTFDVAGNPVIEP